MYSYRRSKTRPQLDLHNYATTQPDPDNDLTPFISINCPKNAKGKEK